MTLALLFLISLQQKCLMIGPGQSLLKISFFLAISFYVYMAGLVASLFKPEVSWRLVPDSDRVVSGPAPVTVMARSPGQADDCGEEPQPAGEDGEARHDQEGVGALILTTTNNEEMKYFLSSPGSAPVAEGRSGRARRFQD